MEVERIDPPEDKEDEAKKDKNGDVEKVFEEIEQKNGMPKPAENPLDGKAAKLVKRDKSDNQLQAALSVLKGIRVYKGNKGAAVTTTPVAPVGTK